MAKKDEDWVDEKETVDSIQKAVTEKVARARRARSAELDIGPMGDLLSPGPGELTVGHGRGLAGGLAPQPSGIGAVYPPLTDDPPRPPGPADLGIGKRYRAAKVGDFSLIDFRTDPVLYAMPDFSKPRDLLIVGDNGTGKTHLASALAIKWGARFVKASRFIVEIRSSFRSGEDSELSILDKYAERNVLVIDDLTAINATEYALTTLLALIDARHDSLLPTIVTTYQGAKKVREIDPSIASRLSGYEIIELVGKDRRAG